MIEHRGAAVPGAYTVVTPGNHYPSRLPELGDHPVVKLVTPRFAPSRIGEYLVSLAATGRSLAVAPGYETFFYILDGDVTLGWGGGGDAFALAPGGYAYLPAAVGWTLAAGGAEVRLLIVKRRYEVRAGLEAPEPRAGHRDDEPFAPTVLDGFTRRELLPVADPAFDFAMSLLRFAPGVGLPNVEVHDEEHGLYLTEGGGTYLLGPDRHEVQAGDFIYMAPYCPQGFAASAGGPAEYLLYKDTWRDGFAFG